jgi:hypothetical protein
MQVNCAVGKPCCKGARTFLFGRNDNLLQVNGRGGGEFVIYRHLLSQDITPTETVMEKGTISCNVIPLESNWTHKHLIKSRCQMCSTTGLEDIPPSLVRRCSSDNDLHLHSGGGGGRSLVGTLEVSCLYSASSDDWWNSMSARQSIATACYQVLT